MILPTERRREGGDIAHGEEGEGGDIAHGEEGGGR